MLRPTYNDLIASLHHDNGDGSEPESRYSVVIASAKRARQLIDGEEPLLPNEEGRKPLSIAIDEISNRVIGIERGSEEEETDNTPIDSYSYSYSRLHYESDEMDDDSEDSEDESEEEDYNDSSENNEDDSDNEENYEEDEDDYESGSEV